MEAVASIVVAESILALTPIVIKTTTLDPSTTIWTRILSSSVFGYLLKGSAPDSGTFFTSPSMLLGYTNLLHIATSYESFRNLPAGHAMSILYTYPMWNIVLASVFRNEQISLRAYGCIAAASVGSVLINLDPIISVSEKKSNTTWGGCMALLMTLTESIMFTIIKSVGWTNPAHIVWITNSWASVWMFIVQFFGEIVDPYMTFSIDSKISMDSSMWETILVTMFHSVSLFSGYWLRNYAITRLSTTTFSILSYSGLLAAYLFGIVFVKEIPGWMSILGAATILVSSVYLLINPT